MKVRLPADAAIDAEIDLCNSGEFISPGRVLASACGLERESPKPS